MTASSSAATYFNVLDARGAISVTERPALHRAGAAHRARASAESWYAQREALGFPLLRDASGREGGRSKPWRRIC